VEGSIPAGFVFVVGLCAVAALTFPQSVARVVVMGVGVGAFGAWAVHYPAVLCTGAMAWCFTTGFLVNAAGELTFGREDLLRLAAFTGVAVAGCACGQVFRALRRHSHEEVPGTWRVTVVAGASGRRAGRAAPGLSSGCAASPVSCRRCSC
jgi:hypothetical protein